MVGKLDPQTKQELKELLGELGPDTWLLLFSNLTVIILAMVQGWNIVPLLWVYWWQSVIIGFFNWRRMKQLKKFSTKGLKVNGHYVQPTGKTKKNSSMFFLLHYGTFQLFYLIFLLTLSESIPSDVLLSAAVGIVIFLFNHFFSYRYNLQKDLTSTPNIGTMMFFPYLRVIPMHLIIFIGAWAGRGSGSELFFFLLLKTGVDLAMHIIEHVDWNEEKKEKKMESNRQATTNKKSKSTAKKQAEQPEKKKRMTVKARLKLWFFLSWVAFLLVILFAVLVMKEIDR